MGNPVQTGKVAINPRPDHVARKPRLVLWIAAIAILGVAMLVVILGTLPLRDAASLEAALDEVRQAGEPPTAAELEAFYAALPADEDPTQLWLDGSAPLVLQPFGDASKGLPIVGEASKVPPPGTPWAELEAAEKLLLQNQKSLALLYQAAARGGAARYPTNFAKGITMLLPHLQNLRGAARLLALEAHVRAHRGDAAGAAQAIETMLAVSDSLENEPLLMSQQVRMAIGQMARQQVAELLPYVLFADEDLLRLQGRLEQIEYQTGLRRALVGERVISQQALQDLGTPAILFRAAAQQVHLDYMQQLLDASQYPFPRALEEARHAQKELNAARDAASGLGKTKYVLIAMVGESMQFNFVAVGRTRARNDATIAAIAIERYSRQHGQPPADLAQLVPDFLKAVPFDPFCGQPLKYVLYEDEYVIYNVGVDGVDNQGQGDDNGKPDDVLRIKLKLGKQ